jgi:CBS domain-containing protein
MPNARDVLSRNRIKGIISTTPKRSVQEASKVMLQRNVGCLIVTEAESKIVGLLTEHDVLCRLVAEDKQMVHYLREYMYGRS